MDKEELLKRARDPKYIPGIYNYCDRWCERCEFTARCLNCSLDDEQNGTLDERDMTNANFWDKFTESLELALSLLQDIAEEQGIDLDSLEIETDEDEDKVVHILSHRSRVYADMVDDCCNTNSLLLENLIQERMPNSHLGSIKPQTPEAFVSLEDAIEVIRWYQYQIHFKLSRALRGKKDEEREGFDDYPKDSDGSAKIALIEMDRSISAWGELLNHLKGQRGEILHIINYLKHLRNMTEIEFPDARAFVRPGFDEQDRNG